MSGIEWFVLLVLAVVSAGVGRTVMKPRRRLLTASDPMLSELAQRLSLQAHGDGLLGEVSGLPLEVRAYRDPKGLVLEVIVPIRARMPVGFLVSRRDPRLQQGAPLGVPRLDRLLQVYTSDTRIPDDLSWLAGQSGMMGSSVSTPSAVRFLSEESVALALEALLPASREGSHVNTSGVRLQERVVSSIAVVDELAQDAVALVLCIERVADPWQRVVEAQSLNASAYDDAGDRVLTGAQDGLQLRAAVVLDAEGDFEGVEVLISPTRAGTTITAGGGGMPLRNIILDGRVCVETSDPDAVQQCLSAPEAAADLMAVFGTWPQSELSDGQLRLWSPVMVGSDTLSEMIEAGYRCAACLR